MILQKSVVGHYRDDELFLSLNNLITQGYVIDSVTRVSKFKKDRANYIILIRRDKWWSPSEGWEQYVSGDRD